MERKTSLYPQQRIVSFQPELPPISAVRSAQTTLKPRLRRRQRQSPPTSSASPSSGYLRLPTFSQEAILSFLYYVSLAFLLLCLIAFIVATPVDTIIQSRNTGQFWNTIIILGAYIFATIIALGIYIVRIISTKRALNAIPHSYYVAQYTSIPQNCVTVIDDELARCQELALKVRPPEGKVSHAGMMPPSISEGGRLVDTPYEDVVAISSTMIESKAAALHPSFTRPVGMPLREYLGFLQSYGMLSMPSVVEDFLNQYEYARFSGNLLTELQFDMYMESCRKLLVSLRLPAVMDNLDNSVNTPWGSRSDSVFSGDLRPSEYFNHNANSSANNSIQWNPTYLQASGLDDQDAFIDTMAQLSRMTTSSSRGPHHVGNNHLPPIQAVSAAGVQHASSGDLSRATSYSSVLRHNTTASQGPNQPLEPLSYYQYSTSPTPNMSRVNSRSSSHNFLSRFRRGASLLHRSETRYSYEASDNSSVVSSSHGSVIIRHGI